MNLNSSSSTLVILSPDLLGLFVVQLLSHVWLCDPWTIARYPSLSPEVCPNSCPLSQWCYQTILSSATPFFFCLQSFPTLGSFQMSWLFTLGGQSTGASVLPSSLQWIQGWFLSELTPLISKLSKELSGVFSSITIQKHQFSGARPSLCFNSHICTWLLEKL